MTGIPFFRGVLLLGVVTALQAPALLAGWAAPEGFFENGQIRRKELAPGVEWIAASGERNGQPLQTHLLAIDLKKSGATLRNLLGSKQFKADSRQRVPRSTVSQLARESGAFAAINTAFFDIKATQAPAGFLLHEGEVLREPERGRGTLLFSKGGTVKLCDVEWSATVHYQGEHPSATLATVNSPYLPEGKFALYRAPWQGTPVDASESEQPVTSLVLEGLERAEKDPPGLLTGRIKAIGQEPAALGEGEAMLVFKGSISSIPFKAKEGEALSISTTWKVRQGCLPVPFDAAEAFSGGAWLVRKGQSLAQKTKSWTLRHPRSAVGIDATGERLLLVAVDGRSEASAGIGLGELADYFVHMACDAALNFDGGGSTALGAMVDGEWRVLNTPSDGPERFVPVGLGVMLPASSPALFMSPLLQSPPRANLQRWACFERDRASTDALTLPNLRPPCRFTLGNDFVTSFMNNAGSERAGEKIGTK